MTPDRIRAAIKLLYPEKTPLARRVLEKIRGEMETEAVADAAASDFKEQV